MNELIILMIAIAVFLAWEIIWRITGFIIVNICFALYRILCKGKMKYRQYIKTMMDKFGLSLI